MSYAFPSAQWVEAFAEAINRNPRYASAGKDWQHGSVAMMIEAEPSLGLDQAVGMLLHVASGRCHQSEYIQGTAANTNAAFIIQGSYGRWREVLSGELDPIRGMMEGKLRLDKGDLPTMIRFVEASRELVKSASHVPTEYVLEASA